MVRIPKVGSGRTVNGDGQLVTYKQDFTSHVEGGGFRQNSSTIDVNPELSSLPGTNLKEVLDRINSYFANGVDYVTIGDGVTTFGSYSIGLDGNNSIEDCLNAAIASDKLANKKGVILIKSGRYDFTTTVDLPAGISIIGELGGTILNATADNPMFEVAECPAYNALTNIVDGYFVNSFYNLTFLDNIDGVDRALLSHGFIYANLGSNISIEKCTCIGKESSGVYFTKYFVEYNVGSSSANSSILSIDKCVILGVHQAVDFAVDSSKANKLTFSNNRVFAYGLDYETGGKLASFVPFVGCDAVLINNDFSYFENDNGEADCCFCCYENPTSKSHVLVSGNSLNRGYIRDALVFIYKNAFGVELSNISASILNNRLGTIYTNSGVWYLTIGDGVNSVGDLTGIYAINYLNTITAGLTVYLFYGNYVINTAYDLKYFSFVGVKSYARPNPSVKIDITGSDLHLSHRIENIDFWVTDESYKNIIFYDSIIQLGTVSNVVVNNCNFKNCGIKRYVSQNLNLPGELLSHFIINDCCFSNVSATYKSYSAITLDERNTLVSITNCKTRQAGFYGMFVTSTGVNDAGRLFEVEIDNCRIYSQGSGQDGYLVFNNTLEQLLGFRLTNSFIDVSESLDSFSCLVCIKGIDSNNVMSNAVVKNNNVIGNNLPMSTNYASNFVYVDNLTCLDMSNNSIKNVGLCLDMFTDTYTSSSINVCNNNVICGTKGFGLCNIRERSVYSGSGRHNIKVSGNNFDSNLASSPKMCIPYSENPNLNYIIAPILVTCTDADVDVSNNNLNLRYITSIADSFHASAIAVVKSIVAKVVDNTIYCGNYFKVGSGGVYCIYVGNTLPDTDYSSQHNRISCLISGNSIVSSINEDPPDSAIKVLDVNSVQITNNRILSYEFAGSYGCYIEAYSRASNTSYAMAGYITDNIFAETLSNGGVIYRNMDSAVIYDRIVAERNVNQTVVKDISCLEFKPYAHNTTTNLYANPVVMLKNIELIYNSAMATNVNSRQLHILSDGYAGKGQITGITSWDDLPDYCLYYTNTYTAATEPQLMWDGDVGYLGLFNSQTIIPINVPNNTTISNIQIPIYVKNISGGPRTLKVSCSLIVGNEDGRVEYISDDLVDWGYTELYADFGTELHTTLSHDNINEFLSPVRNVSALTTPSSQQNVYILLGLTSDDDGINPPGNGIFFAIPYAKVTFIY